MKILYARTRILKDDEIVVFVDDLADSAVVIGARAWVKNEEFWPTNGGF